MRMEDNTNKSRIWEERKKVRSSHETYYAPRPTDEYFVRFRANAQNPPLLSSHFFFIRGHEMVLLGPNE